ncbi:maleylpyruvate isomerase family mycothiol-dependent enzyme [Micromonospora sp. WMMD812]|uniref:maleylpyruvate isomerase family mycothiol-dependent enzyme n=1 Tax=Micromonospora sp. WMMD812 TaxID=3015152 RepID=UPI00248D24DF|nr:maleylpyruvate isomerase family mycothiol-dependent enzyme [Micromonospora sp. WMMD812]WBB70845.1 maleylpyruvate isomerase family mycothiol-dependent enzyme [Micromonospora sp. WMMD812]
MSFDGWCDEIVAQAELMAAHLAGADPRTPVPSCPGWTVGQLVRHVGAGHRWAEEIVRTRAATPLPDTDLRDLSGHADGDPAILAPWLVEGAAQLAGTLRAAGPRAEVWTPIPGRTDAAFYARRFAHETLVHRADAALALGVPFAAAEPVAVDALDEWMELDSLPVMLEFKPERRELLGPGRTLHLHATDTAPEAAAEWVVDLTGEIGTWRRAHEKAAVAVRGPLTELLLTVYGRRPPHDTVQVLGDRGLLELWLARVSFG